MPGKAQCFAVRRGQIADRADVNYSAASIIFGDVYANAHFPLVALRDLVTLVQYGTSALTTEEAVGVPVLRMNNLQDDGWDLTDLKYLNLSPEELETYRLEKGDLLFNRTNSKELVGKSEVFRDDGAWAFASYLIRVRVDQERVLPDLVSAFLSTKAGRVQIDGVSRQIIGMTNVNAEELRDLVIPLPPMERQKALLADLTAARASRSRKLAEAETLLSGMDQFLLDELGLTPPPKDTRRVYAVKAKQARDEDRISADFFHPERVLAIKAIKACRNAKTAARLADIVEFHRDVEKDYNPGDYLGLSGVQSQTGELSTTAEEPGEGMAFLFVKGDVLFARLRPYLNKVWRAEHGGVCSTEFHVLRVNVANLLPDYLAAVLRSSIVVAQTKHMMTGNTHPRLANEDVCNLFIPIPDEQVQLKITAELSKRRKEARRLREEATREWDAAKARFEAALLGKGAGA